MAIVLSAVYFVSLVLLAYRRDKKQNSSCEGSQPSLRGKTFIRKDKGKDSNGLKKHWKPQEVRDS